MSDLGGFIPPTQGGFGGGGGFGGFNRWGNTGMNYQSMNGYMNMRKINDTKRGVVLM